MSSRTPQGASTRFRLVAHRKILLLPVDIYRSLRPAMRTYSSSPCGILAIEDRRLLSQISGAARLGRTCADLPRLRFPCSGCQHYLHTTSSIPSDLQELEQTIRYALAAVCPALSVFVCTVLTPCMYTHQHCVTGDNPHIAVVQSGSMLLCCISCQHA